MSKFKKLYEFLKAVDVDEGLAKKDLIAILVKQGKTWNDIVSSVPAFKDDDEALGIYKKLTETEEPKEVQLINTEQVGITSPQQS